MVNPLQDLKTPLYDVSSIDNKQSDNRPRGYIQVRCLTKPIDDNLQFMASAWGSTLSVLKSLRQKPLATQESQYKLNQDIDQGVLISLKDFLLNSEVIGRGIS